MTRTPVSCLTSSSARSILRVGLQLLVMLALFAGSGSAQSLVIKRVSVIDATGRTPALQPNLTVVIDGDRIIAVEPSNKARIPKSVVVVDGAGKFLIPGLWDMHVHGASDDRAPWSHLLFIANGVVGVRDMSGPIDAHAWRAKQVSNSSSNEDPSPVIYLGSPIVDGPNPVWPDSIVVADEAQAREVVDQQQQRGADFIKVYSRLPRNAYFAIADESARRGIPFEGHVPESITAEEASDAGQKSIEHLTRVALSCSKEGKKIDAELQRLEALFREPQTTTTQRADIGKRIIAQNTRIIQTFDDPTAQALFARFVKNRTWQCPTLTLLQGQIDDPLPASDPRLSYLSNSVREKWDAGYYRKFPPEARARMVELTKAEFAESKQIVNLMYRAGVPILAGTDTMNPQCYPGFGIHDELALLVNAGLPPLAALQAATRNAADFMGHLDRRGTIETGKVADLVLLDKNPLSDIHNTRTIRAVVLNGHLFSRPALDAMLAKAQMLAARSDNGVAQK